MKNTQSGQIVNNRFNRLSIGTTREIEPLYHIMVPDKVIYALGALATKIWNKNMNALYATVLIEWLNVPSESF